MAFMFCFIDDLPLNKLTFEVVIERQSYSTSNITVGVEKGWIGYKLKNNTFCGILQAIEILSMEQRVVSDLKIQGD